MAEPASGNGGKRGGVAYLRRTLTMNPLYEADAIIALRSRAFKLKNPDADSPAPADAASRRAEALAQLETIRKACWSDPPAELVAQLNRLDVDGLPEVRQAAGRLMTVAQCRERLPSLSQHKHFDGEFFSCLKQVLAASPRETAVLREQVLASFRSGKLRKRGRRMIKLIEKESPELYALEADWFATLLQQKTTARTKDDGTVIETDSGGGIPFWVWWLLFIIGINVLRGFASLQ